MKQVRLLVHPSIEPLLEKLRTAIPASLLLQGEVGVGLHLIAMSLSRNIEEVIEPLDAKGNIDHIAGSISVDTIRSLYQSTRGKSTRDYVIIIDDAERMTASAQHAFLKLLEEPPQRAHFVLTTHTPTKLLPTIRSRVLAYQIPRITPEQSKLYLHRANVDEQTATQLLFLADGRPALLRELAENNAAREKAVSLVRDARVFITASPYERLVVVHSHATRPDALKLLDTALSLLRFAFKNNDATISVQITALLAAYEAIANGGNVKLHLTHAVVQ